MINLGVDSMINLVEMVEGLHLILVKDDSYAVVSIDLLLVTKKGIVSWGPNVIEKLEHALSTTP